ncbi:hypothetical protein CAPTEDRAFT_223666 [Capitella teleta]|uniref:Fibronectin type-III domain-containing protein n=1 Tax=Capitella teleta TaxID=283909 RepID=R7UTI4_CAPTE|nr:hypothetical protein CAPTEDRAFT_223666 [Capitella teleta]|eukprot:ELU09468.1 hypothetical protein CAPTEDRAFT_223666 [Capitella teleta]
MAWLLFASVILFRELLDVAGAQDGDFHEYACVDSTRSTPISCSLWENVQCNDMNRTVNSWAGKPHNLQVQTSKCDIERISWQLPQDSGFSFVTGFRIELHSSHYNSSHWEEDIVCFDLQVDLSQFGDGDIYSALNLTFSLDGIRSGLNPKTNYAIAAYTLPRAPTAFATKAYEPFNLGDDCKIPQYPTTESAISSDPSIVKQPTTKDMSVIHKEKIVCMTLGIIVVLIVFVVFIAAKSGLKIKGKLCRDKLHEPSRPPTPTFNHIYSEDLPFPPPLPPYPGFPDELIYYKVGKNNAEFDNNSSVDDGSAWTFKSIADPSTYL